MAKDHTPKEKPGGNGQKPSAKGEAPPTPVEAEERSIIPIKLGKIPAIRVAISQEFRVYETETSFWIRVEADYPIDTDEEFRSAGMQLLQEVGRLIDDAGAERRALIATGELPEPPASRQIIDSAEKMADEYGPSVDDDPDHHQVPDDTPPLKNDDIPF